MRTRLAVGGLLALAGCLLISLQLNAQQQQTTQGQTTTKKPQTITQPQTNTQAQTATKTQAEGEKRAYLGVAFESLDPVLTKQLPQLKGRGVVVAEVANDSPAEKAGLKPYDIIVSFDNHQIFSPEQAVKLVQNDKPGRTASLDVFRAGKEEKLNVTLGEHQVMSGHAQYQMPMGFGQPPWSSTLLENKNGNWDLFDTMTLSRVDDKHFKADIKFRDDKGKVDHKTFEGTREEIQKALDKERDLPADEREHLLRALDLRPQSPDFGIPQFFFNPRGGGPMWDIDDLNRFRSK